MLELVPHSGTYFGIESAVEKAQRGKCYNAEVLVETVNGVWAEVTSVEAFTNVFERLPIIYNNIRRNYGGNDLVESNRGKAAKENTLGDVVDLQLFELDEEEDEVVAEDQGQTDEDLEDNFN